jgi:hypothetical protein
MKEVSPLTRFGLLLLLGAATAGCSNGAPAAFALNSASVDSPYACPSTANNSPYNVHATIEVRNGTSSTVTIRSVAARMTLAATKGSWLQKVGDKYEATAVKFTPETIGAGSFSSVQVAIPSACTSGKTAKVDSSYGDYSIELTVVASSGTYKIASVNRHRILAG